MKYQMCALLASASTAFNPIIESGELISELMRLTIARNSEWFWWYFLMSHIIYIYIKY